MVKIRKMKSIPDRSSPGLTRTALDVIASGHQSTSGLQGSVSPAGQPGQAAVELLEETTKRKKWSTEVNRKIMHCYFESNPKKREFQKRMIRIWKEKYPDSDISEQRLMDQRRFILRAKVFTELELQEMEREIEVQNSSELEEIIMDDKEHDNEVNIIQTGEENKIGEVEEVQTDTRNDSKLTVRQLGLKEKILADMKSDNDRKRLPTLNKFSSYELRKIVNEANLAIKEIRTTSLKETNQLIYSTARVITLELGYKIEKSIQKTGPPKWKTRLEKKINNLRADISNLKNLKEKRLKNDRIRNSLLRRYDLDCKTISEISEELKQRVIAVSKKIIRYEARIHQFQQNQQFRTNQHIFYRGLCKINDGNKICPDKDETVTFWRNIWDDPKEHRGDAKWINDITKDIETSKMKEIIITPEMVKMQVKKIKNWSAPGNDQVHGYWIKHLTELHVQMAAQFNKMLQERDIEEWMTTGRTFLIMKDKEKGAIPSNYRPITCLPTMFKLFTGILASSVSSYLFENLLYPVEQKGNYKNSRGTKDQLLIDKMVLKNCKKRKTNLYMAWIDYRKAFDSLPHSWIQQCLEILGISTNIRIFLKEAMKMWKTILTVNGEELGTINIRRGIFQGDSLSPLLFTIAMIPLTRILGRTELGYEVSKECGKISHLLYMDDIKLYGKSDKELASLLNTVRIFSEDIQMEFGLDKCATLEMKRGKIQQHEGITFEKGNSIKALPMAENYKYLGILEADDILHSQVKEKTGSEYIKRIRKVLKSKLNGGNTIKAINTWAVPVIRYTAGIIDWTQAELEALDRKTRKQMTINHALHPRSDIDRLYLSRTIGGRGLLQIKQTVEEEKRGLNDYIIESKEKLLIEVCKEGVIKTTGTKKEYKQKELIRRMESWKEKPLHGQHLREIEGKVDQKNWKWLQIGTIKKETEGLIFAAQEQALQTNVMKAKIQKVSNNSKCRLCKTHDETVDHLISGCSKIVQTDYKQRHDRVAKLIHWNLCKKYSFDVSKNHYDHQIENVIENADAKILWDFRIQTDRHLKHNTPDITVIEKNKVWFIDVAIPGESRIEEKELEKIIKYRDLVIEINRLWQKQCKVVPIIIGALGSITKNLRKHLQTLNIQEISPTDLQKTALLGTSYILRRYLDNS